MQDEINVQMLQEIAPRSVKPLIDQKYADDLNALITDPECAQFIRDSMITSKEVIQSGKYSFEQYINACKYATFKNMGETNISSFIKTFPDKYQTWLAQGKSDKEISRYVAAFNKSKCVEEVITKVSMSFYVQNLDVRQQALETQVHLMLNSKSDMVKQQAANSVLTHTKPPEEGNKLEVNIGVNTENTMLSDLREQVSKLTELNKQQIAAGGATAQQVAHSRLFNQDGEIEDVDTNP